jgi:hypothetical protein
MKLPSASFETDPSCIEIDVFSDEIGTAQIFGPGRILEYLREHLKEHNVLCNSLVMRDGSKFDSETIGLIPAATLYIKGAADLIRPAFEKVGVDWTEPLDESGSRFKFVLRPGAEIRFPQQGE